MFRSFGSILSSIINNTNQMQRLIRMMKEKTVMMVMESTDEYLAYAFVWVAVNWTAAVNHVVIRATAVNPHPLSQLHEHDFDDISNHLHAYTFYYSLKYGYKLSIPYTIHRMYAFCLQICFFLKLTLFRTFE